jgi:transcriptional regulator with XRE-family HTH domain
MRAKGFPGTDPLTNDRMMSEIAVDQDAIVAAISSLREKEAASLEEIGFLLGIGPGSVSQYLSGVSGTSLTNYLRIARALGYRCRLVFERVDAPTEGSSPASNQKILPPRELELGRARQRSGS